MCSYNAIQSGTLNTEEASEWVGFHLYCLDFARLSLALTLRVSLSLCPPPRSSSSFSPFTSLTSKFTCTTAAAAFDAAKERSVVQGAPAAAAAHVALLLLSRPPRPGQQTLQMGQKDLTERPR